MIFFSLVVKYLTNATFKSDNKMNNEDFHLAKQQIILIFQETIFPFSDRK